MLTYLVTGGAGFIGSNFIKYLFKTYKDILVINLDNLTYAGNLCNLNDIDKNPNYYFIKGDVCDKDCLDYIFKEYDINFVVNFAAESHVDRSIKDPSIFIKTNVLGTQLLLDATLKKWMDKDEFLGEKKFLQVSTDEVYGSLGKDGYFEETIPLDPHSPYSASKASADMIVKAYYDTYKMPLNITRCSNNYGPYQFPEKLIPLAINNCLNGKEIPIYGDGRNIRDWLYVEDHCIAIDMVLRYGQVGEVYNIGGSCEKENIQLVDSIISTLNILLKDDDIRKGYINKNLIKYVEDRKGHDRRYAIDSSKISRELGWSPKTTFETGIIKTVQWYIENGLWLQNVTSGEYEKYYDQMYNKV